VRWPVRPVLRNHLKLEVSFVLLTEALDGVKRIHTELAYLRGISGLFFWDQWNGLPAEGRPFRQKLEGYLAEKRIALFNSAEAKALAGYWQAAPLAEIEGEVDRAIVRSFLFEYRQTVNIPVEKSRQMVALANQGREAWIKARAEQSYELFKPVLQEIFKLRVELAGYINPDRPAFEVMVGASDEGISLPDINRAFDRIKAVIPALVRQIRQSPVEIDDAFLADPFDPRELLDFVKLLVEKMGYDKNKGGYGEVIHPFTNISGPKDARITVNCGTYRLGVFGALHEAGHALYACRGNPEIDAADLWGGAMGGFHEAQSRFYENIIGKSRAFWEFFYPEAQKRFTAFADISLDDYYRAINSVRPSLNRITADEVTYSLHPIIRFELEQDVIEGRIDFDELPRAWNDRYEAYLGLRPTNDAEGLLQDIHWSAGALGYFQSYTLGNIYGGQIRNALLDAVPNVTDAIAAGNFAPLNDWLTENIHQYGNCYTAPEMIRRISGGPLDAGPFVDYLYRKYGPIYQLAPEAAGMRGE